VPTNILDVVEYWYRSRQQGFVKTASKAKSQWKRSPGFHFCFLSFGFLFRISRPNFSSFFRVRFLPAIKKATASDGSQRQRHNCFY